MAALILAAFSLFAAGATAGIIGVVCVAIRREEKNLTLTSEVTDHVTRAGRWLNGVGVRAPRRCAAADQHRAPAWPSPASVRADAAPDRQGVGTADVSTAVSSKEHAQKILS